MISFIFAPLSSFYQILENLISGPPKSPLVSKNLPFHPSSENSKIQHKKVSTNDDLSFHVRFLILVRIINKWTFQQTMFNPLREFRPLSAGNEAQTSILVRDDLEEIPSLCDFCSPLSYTAIGKIITQLEEIPPLCEFCSPLSYTAIGKFIT